MMSLNMNNPHSVYESPSISFARAKGTCLNLTSPLQPDNETISLIIHAPQGSIIMNMFELAKISYNVPEHEQPLQQEI